MKHNSPSRSSSSGLLSISEIVSADGKRPGGFRGVDFAESGFGTSNFCGFSRSTVSPVVSEVLPWYVLRGRFRASLDEALGLLPFTGASSEDVADIVETLPSVQSTFCQE